MNTLKGLRILVVDDEQAIREMIEEELTFEGAIVKTARNGEIAFKMIKESTFDAVLSDIRMPGGDGVGLVKNLKIHFPGSPKIFLCSGFSDQHLATLKEYGVIAIFAKPFEWDDMIQTIANEFIK